MVCKEYLAVRALSRSETYILFSITRAKISLDRNKIDVKDIVEKTHGALMYKDRLDTLICVLIS